MPLMHGHPEPAFSRMTAFALASALAFFGFFSFAAAQAPPQSDSAAPAADAIIPNTSPERISDHVYAIEAFPNIGFIVGQRAILVVDTGMGPRNGTTVAKTATKLAPNRTLYLTTTHFHPEHATGDSGFPPATILIRPQAQQKELQDDHMAIVNLFRARNAQRNELLQNVNFRAPDILFDKEITLDLGGVTARLFWLGPAHTAGDELIDVEPDRTLLPGDIVMDKTLPSVGGPGASLDNWINILSQLLALQPLHIVPDHGKLGDGSLIAQEYDLLSNLRSRSLELKREGKSEQDAGQLVLAEFKSKYSNWPNLSGIPALVGHIYSENP